MLRIPIYIILLIFSVIIHEVSHGLVADKLGDPTARLSGRLTLNPILHIDPVGSILLPLLLIITNSGFLFGWAKPVPFDPYNLRDPRRDAALISLAGPGSNLLIALVSALLLRLLLLLSQPVAVLLGTYILVPLVTINVMLGIFNLVPIHPLDGFKIVGGFLSREKAQEWYQLERYGTIFLLILIFPFAGRSMLSYFVSPIMNAITSLLLPR